MKPTQPIPSLGQKTKYRGIEFKSKAEARWAAVFDVLGWSWEYEPNGESTFPDFKVISPWGCESSVEVKGSLQDDRDFKKHPDAEKARSRDPDFIAGDHGTLWSREREWAESSFKGWTIYTWNQACALATPKRGSKT